MNQPHLDPWVLPRFFRIHRDTRIRVCHPGSNVRIRIRFMWIRIQPKISMQIRIQGANRIQIRIHDSLKQIFGDIMYEYIDMYGYIDNYSSFYSTGGNYMPTGIF
jgi:hypothetical protein